MATPWHRIFGMALAQYFSGTAWQVDVEVDLSLQQQRLDIVILRRGGQSIEPSDGPSCDGNEDDQVALERPTRRLVR